MFSSHLDARHLQSKESLSLFHVSLFSPLAPESRLALLTARANEFERGGVDAWNMTLFRNLAYREDGRLMSQSNHLVGVWMPGSFIDSEREAMRN